MTNILTSELENLAEQSVPRLLFHGTSSDSSFAIEQDGLEPNCDGYAFFEGSYNKAYTWAKMKCRILKMEDKKKRTPVVYCINTSEVPEVNFEYEGYFDHLSFFKNSRIYKTEQKIQGYRLRRIGKLKGIMLRLGRKIK